MSRISDELRDYGRRLVSNASPFNCTFGYIRAYQDELADRIDAETVELPKDADGKPIHVGSELFEPDGTRWEVSRIEYYDGGVNIVAHSGHAELVLEPQDYRAMVHDRPDSWERIADEIEESDVDGCIDWADRIRRLAEKE